MPSSVPDPPASWSTPYGELARDNELAWTTLEELTTAVAAFIGEMAEGFVIDTDHWRHFYLLLGIIWGLAAVTQRQARTMRLGVPPGTRPVIAR